MDKPSMHRPFRVRLIRTLVGRVPSTEASRVGGQSAKVGAGAVFDPQDGRLESVDDPLVSQLELGRLIVGPAGDTTNPLVLFDNQKGVVRYSVRLWPQTPIGARAMLKMLLVRRVVQRLGLENVIGHIVLLRGIGKPHGYKMSIAERNTVVPVFGFAQEWTIANATGKSADEYFLTGSGNVKVRLSQLVHATNGTVSGIRLAETKDELLQRDVYGRISDAHYEQFCVAMFVLCLWDVAPRNIVFQFRADGSVVPRWVDIEDAVLSNSFSLRYTNILDLSTANFIGWKDVRARSTLLGDTISKMNLEKEFDPDHPQGLFRSLRNEKRLRDSHIDYLGISELEAFKAGFPDIPDLATPPKITIWVRGELNDETWKKMLPFASRAADVVSVRALLQKDPLLAPQLVQNESAQNLRMLFPAGRVGSQDLFDLIYRQFETPGTEIMNDGKSPYYSANLSSRLGKLQALYAVIGATPSVATSVPSSTPSFSDAFGALIEQQRANHIFG